MFVIEVNKRNEQKFDLEFKISKRIFPQVLEALRQQKKKFRVIAYKTGMTNSLMLPSNVRESSETIKEIEALIQKLISELPKN